MKSLAQEQCVVERHRLYADQDPHRIFCFAADPDPYPFLKLDQVNKCQTFYLQNRTAARFFSHKAFNKLFKKICDM